MLKQSVRYTDFDDNEAIETLYFNLTKTELTDNLNLKDELENLQQDFVGDPKRVLTEKEIRRILDLVKTFMRLSYGVRSEDGKRFIKTSEIWEEFTQTAAYDAFLFSLFQDPTNALNFMTGILPKDLRQAALDAANKQAGGTDAIKTASVLAAQAEQAKRAEAAEAAKQEAPTLSAVEDIPDKKPVLSDNPTQEELEAMVAWMSRNQ
ncbi:hypothetical protein HWD32_gp54 [Gordonia phage Secretariat]|uniref:Tail assembly chaperone n=1 Tax=Gordonia phage Secretariat TaxID=2725616 RepID=A0A6M3T6S1_9CAUD|nr:hypothetical protein HWD32_gp54 [Gordonia phage Secretariat]QJD49631.1 hypothetical protein SEA_SECRETARIAT_54 [Gordonia phage Secretariat]